jgi:hypothetical protein
MYSVFIFFISLVVSSLCVFSQENKVEISFKDASTKENLSKIKIIVKGENKYKLDTFVSTNSTSIVLLLPSDNIFQMSIVADGYRKISQNVSFEQGSELKMTVLMEKSGLFIKGRVSESSIGAPLQGIKVKLVDKTSKEIKHTMTNINGEYLYNVKPNSSYTLSLDSSIAMTNYRVFSLKTSDNTDKTYEKDFEINLMLNATNSLQSNSLTIIKEDKKQGVTIGAKAGIGLDFLTNQNSSNLLSNINKENFPKNRDVDFDLVQKSELAYSPKLGYSFGINIDIPLINKLYFSPEINYSTGGQNYYDNLYDNTFEVVKKINIQEVNACALFRGVLNNNPKKTTYLKAGPYLSYLFGIKEMGIINGDVYIPSDIESGDYESKLNFGGSAEIGKSYTVSKNMIIDLGLNAMMGINDINKNQGFVSKNNTDYLATQDFKCRFVVGIRFATTKKMTLRVN